MSSFEQLFEKGKFPDTKRVLHQIATSAKESLIQKTLAAKPAWWGRMAMSNKAGGGGGILLGRIPGGYKVYHPNKGKYNYLATLERGRGRYDMRPSLLGGSRARTGENGPYVIVPIRKNENGTPVSPKNNLINSAIIKIGTFKEENAHGQMVTRNKYKYRIDPGMTGRGNAFVAEQKYKNGNVKRSYLKFVVVNQFSKNFFQPAIPAQKIFASVKEDVNKALKSKILRSAVASDSKALILDLLKKRKRT
ncbi:hypothetical protein LFX25_20665 [Leptospira sp. FAT2]|uniref:hypothetical protein n=1 Tax=Leptospira sanjuanensis TaxID=2879643 RepID=UPI001EE85C98|nr:hypothetical protein [Leptospira sanjuanensis]MCG6195659.1 hypothetical protein [Leptospira sanjuanensis]